MLQTQLEAAVAAAVAGKHRSTRMPDDGTKMTIVA